MKLLWYRLARIAVSLQLLTASESQLASEVSNVYVSQHGSDTPSCGTDIQPCKTIAMGVWLAKQHARVYVDGTGSETTPFSCKSSAIEIPGIHANKSLSIIGVHSMVHVKCQQGSDVNFVKSALETETMVSVSNIKFITTTVQGQDISLDINECIFNGDRQAVNLVQSTKSITMLFTNSQCVNVSSCMAVNVTGRVLPTNKVSIEVTNSNVVESWSKNADLASGIHLTSSDESKYEPGSIICEVTLKNLTFKYNSIGTNGLIFVNAKNANTFIGFENVLFLRSKMKATMPGLVTIRRSSNLKMNLTNASFVDNFEGNCRALEANVENASSLYIANSRFEMFNTGKNGEAGLLYLISKNDCKVTIENASFVNNIGGQSIGGMVFLKSRYGIVNVKDSYFHNNQAGCAGIAWLDVEKSITAKIHGCHFKSSTAFGVGGLASIQSQETFVEMVNCTVNESITDGPGGLLDVGHMGCGTSRNAHNATLIMRNVEVVGSGSREAEGGVAVIQAITGSILIQSSKFTDIFSSFQGGVICAYYIQGGMHERFIHTVKGYDIMIINVTFKKIRTSASPGQVLYSNGVKNLHLDNVNIESMISGGNRPGPGGPLYIDSPLDGNVVINNTIVRDCTGWGSAVTINIATAKSTLQIMNSLFDSNTGFESSGGCLSFHFGITITLFQNVTFHRCVSGFGKRGSGGALYLSGQTGGNITLFSCHFIGNMAPKNAGGAVAFDLQLKDKIIDPGCTQTLNSDEKTGKRIWSYNSLLCIRNTTFFNNTATNGGALSLSRGRHIIQECSFLENYADLLGGHIFLTSESTSLKVLHSRFLQNHSVLYHSSTLTPKVKSTIGVLIYSESEGPLMIFNTTMESMWSRYVQSKSLIYISKGNLIDFGDNNQTIVKCPIGSSLDILNYTTIVDTEYQSKPCKIALTLLQFNCKSCPIDTYSLQYGHSLGMTKVSGFKCLPCPFGAVCHNKISAKPNYWGYEVKENPQELSFTQCPLGYCNMTDVNDFVDYNRCLGNRSGTLCGRCKEKYSETLLSTSCCHDDECKDTWLWGVVVVMVMLMALYLIHKPRLLHMLKRQILWFKYSTDEEDEGEKHDSGGYLKILFYFYQVVNIVLVTTSYNNTIKLYLVQPIIGLFNFQFRLSSSGLLCPFGGLTAVTKQLLFASQVFGVVVMIGVCYFCHRVLRLCRSRPPPNMGPYLGAVVETLLLGYAVFANTSLQLLRCTSLARDWRLFIDGTVSCYQWWQYLLMVFVGTAVVPFILTLALGSHWLHKRSISVKEFILGCVLPLPYLLYKVISLLRGTHEANQESREWRAAVTKVLFGPFRAPQDDSFGAVYWESILISRRLILIVIYVFVHDPLSKELLLAFTSVAILLHHTIVRPFRDPSANIVEMVSLFCLFTLASINTFKASFISFGEVQKGPLMSFEDIVDWIQIIILTALPVVFLLAVLAAILSQIVRLIIKGLPYIAHACMKSRDVLVIDDVDRNLLEPCSSTD
ncbi:uncharacterized protein LOC110253693 [Exaiptasia diaphana]|uniref:Uncharacterized protein n=1 Tax=Exaiptasia diaphana TaxID=2652724 RepID=A0A913Y9J4_EXADI|nr:uncharacterized protein LOC110253693 [Exaiptasia diaphana]